MLSREGWCCLTIQIADVKKIINFFHKNKTKKYDNVFCITRKTWSSCCKIFFPSQVKPITPRSSSLSCWKVHKKINADFAFNLVNENVTLVKAENFFGLWPRKMSPVLRIHLAENFLRLSPREQAKWIHLFVFTKKMKNNPTSFSPLKLTF